MSETGLITPERALLTPLGDSAMLVRFGTSLDDAANRAALSLAGKLAIDPIAGVLEVVPSLVSVLLRFDPDKIEIARLSGEIGLRLTDTKAPASKEQRIGVQFGGAAGPDLAEVAETLGLSADEFTHRHCASTLRVLATGFAPGFVYCGFHPDTLFVPRRQQVRAQVPAGTVLFAAGQTAVAATDIPTGWHVIGHTDFRNFNPTTMPPTRLTAGDMIRFEML